MNDGLTLGSSQTAVATLNEAHLERAIKPSQLHVIEPGQSPQEVAVMYGVTESALRQANDLGPGQAAYPGTALSIPSREPTPGPENGDPALQAVSTPHMPIGADFGPTPPPAEPGPPVPQPPRSQPSELPQPTGAHPYSYDMTLDIFPVVGGKEVSGEAMFSFWMNNFSKMFLPGAPDNPKAGDRFNLGGTNPVEVVEVGSRHFTLRSLPGHAEGPDNYITFTISPDGKTLQVSARGPVDRGVVGEGVIPGVLFNGLAAHIQNVRMVNPDV